MSDPGDRTIVEVQIGRPLRADSSVVARCHLALPVVVEVPPRLDDGTPFPTLYWLTCPLATSRIGRLEGSGGVRRMEQKAEVDPDFGKALDHAHESYAARRDAMLDDDDEPRPSGGVGGTRQGIKCLHAHYAHTAAGGENPVGQVVASWIEPLDCVEPCVKDGAMNPEWNPAP
jgi:uncharacterized protein